MGGLIYHDGKLVSIDTPEGRAVPLDSTNQDFTCQFFYNDHLGNLRVAYSVARYRAKLLEGSFEVLNTNGHGCTATLTIPLKPYEL